MEQWKCDGMLVDALQFCTYWASEGYIYQEICKNNNFPFLNLNHELYGGGTGQLKTRIEAFREQIMNAKYMKQGKETS
jgi:benzoyl-CoA reductase/2-hydroxyglutaryl-CoA dehydratase subunit BcrC/BadD/HgdB